MSYSKLRGKIREVFGTQEAFATAMDMNTATLSGKLNGKTDWTRVEMEQACSLLGVSMMDMHSYFFLPQELRKRNSIKTLCIWTISERIG